MTTYEETRDIINSGQLEVQSNEKIQEMRQSCITVDTFNQAKLEQRNALLTILQGEIGRRNADARHQEAKKPHWTMKWGFAVAFASMVFAGIAAWPVIREWFSKPQQVEKSINLPMSQTNSTATALATQQMPLPSTNIPSPAVLLSTRATNLP